MFYVWCEIVCEHCSKTTSGRHVGKQNIPRKGMKEDAIRQGWFFIRSEQTAHEVAVCSVGCKELYLGSS